MTLNLTNERNSLLKELVNIFLDISLCMYTYVDISV